MQAERYSLPRRVRRVVRLHRRDPGFLFSSVVYPTDYGFIPDTLSQDGDPLGVMVCVSEPTFPGCMIDVKPIALFRMEDDKGLDDKVLCKGVRVQGWFSRQDAVDEIHASRARFREARAP
jgi:inorganic pyrophosphatase